MAGEALGLKWSDIDLNIGMLRVNQQVQRIRDDGVLVFSEPKNSSRHTMDLPQRAAEALSRSHCKRQAEEKARRDALGGLRARSRDDKRHPPGCLERRQPPLQAPA